jgi:GNAT superfamily N-acetyltransferase
MRNAELEREDAGGTGEMRAAASHHRDFGVGHDHVLPEAPEKARRFPSPIQGGLVGFQVHVTGPFLEGPGGYNSRMHELHQRDLHMSVHFERRRGRFLITTDPARIDVDAAHAFLDRSYWAEGIPKELLAKAIASSLCFALLDGDRQVGLARVVTDRATFAYLCDVYVLEDHRGAGLGKWLIEELLTHPDLQGLRRLVLATRDAHGLYARFGFEAPKNPQVYMEIVRPDIYRQR